MRLRSFIITEKTLLAQLLFLNIPPPLAKKTQKKPTKECLGVGPIVQTTVSPYSPADQQALGGDWLGGAGATKDPFCSFRG